MSALKLLVTSLDMALVEEDLLHCSHEFLLSIFSMPDISSKQAHVNVLQSNTLCS